MAALIVMTVGAGAYLLSNRGDEAPKNDPGNNKIPIGNSEMHKLPDMRLSYVIDLDAQQMYAIVVASGESVVTVAGKACNSMSSTIGVVDKDQKTNQNVVKVLNDGRKVLKPQTASTMMACADTTPQTDDQALSRHIDAIAESLQSY